MRRHALLGLLAACSFSAPVENMPIDDAPISDPPADAPPVDSSSDGAPDAPPPFLLRIDVGSSTDFIDSANQTWVADTYCAGDLTEDPGPVRGTTDDPLYATGRFRINADVTCTVPVPNGPVHVVLHLAELWIGGAQSCNFGMQRTMDVELEGTRVANDVNVWAMSQGCARDGVPNSGQPFALPYDVTISDGMLEVRLRPGNAGSRDPLLQGLELSQPGL